MRVTRRTRGSHVRTRWEDQTTKHQGKATRQSHGSSGLERLEFSPGRLPQLCGVIGAMKGREQGKGCPKRQHLRRERGVDVRVCVCVC